MIDAQKHVQEGGIANNHDFEAIKFGCNLENVNLTYDRDPLFYGYYTNEWIQISPQLREILLTLNTTVKRKINICEWNYMTTTKYETMTI